MVEERKLIRLGNSSFAIALPKEWVDKSGLKKGDKISIVPNSSGELVIIANYEKRNGEDNKIEIDLKDKDENRIRKEIMASYINGSDIFHFVGKEGKETTSIIKKAIEGLLSLEIAENGEIIVVRDFFNIQDMNLVSFVKRMDNNIREMFEVFIDSFKNKKANKNQIKEIDDIDKDITRFHLLFSRMFMKGIDNPSILSTLKTTPKTLFNFWWVSFNMEKIGDQFKILIDILKNMDFEDKRQENILNIILKINKIYLDSIESFYKNDNKLAIQASIDGKDVWEKCDFLSNDKNAFIARFASRLKEIENSIYQTTKITLYNP